MPKVQLGIGKGWGFGGDTGFQVSILLNITAFCWLVLNFFCFVLNHFISNRSAFFEVFCRVFCSVD